MPEMTADARSENAMVRQDFKDADEESKNVMEQQDYEYARQLQQMELVQAMSEDEHKEEIEQKQTWASRRADLERSNAKFEQKKKMLKKKVKDIDLFESSEDSSDE